MKQNRLAVIAVILTLSVLLCALTSACGTEPEPAPTESPAATQTPTQAETTAATPAEAEPTEPEPTEPAITVPDSMAVVLALVGETAASLQERGCTQLVTVSSEGSSATLRFYQLDGYDWTQDTDLTADGYVGYNGVTADMHEGGYATPFGMFSVGEAFYINSEPQTGLTTFQITYDTYWVDDPSSVYYNRRIVGTENRDWSSAEEMYYITPQYNYGFVINYNVDPVVPGAGSAIFFHCGSNPTAGCVGTSEDVVLRYLAALSADCNPYIAIV